MRLGPFIGRGAFGDLAGSRIDEIMALRRPLDPIDRVETRIEPLGAVRRRHLARQHVQQLVVEGGRVFLRVEIARSLAPFGPCIGEPMEDLSGVGLAIPVPFGRERALGLGDEGRPGSRPVSGHSRLPEVLLGNYVGGDLAPGRGHDSAFHIEYRLAVGVSDFALSRRPFDAFIGAGALFREFSLEFHYKPPLYYGITISNKINK